MNTARPLLESTDVAILVKMGLRGIDTPSPVASRDPSRPSS
jgi:hypothetical protein